MCAPFLDALHCQGHSSFLGFRFPCCEPADVPLYGSHHAWGVTPGTCCNMSPLSLGLTFLFSLCVREC